MKKTIKIVAYNTFYNQEILSVTMPYNPFKSLFGYYSGFWRAIKPSLGFPVEQIVAKISFPLSGTGRMIFKFNSGVSLDLPPNPTKKDFAIILAQLNVLLMAK